MFKSRLKLAAITCAALVAAGERDQVVAQATVPPPGQVIKGPNAAPGQPPVAPVPGQPNVAPVPFAKPAIRINGMLPARQAPAESVLQADAIVIGKVTKIEDKEQHGHQVAVVSIEESLKGAKGLTSIRIGFIPPPAGPQAPPAAPVAPVAPQAVPNVRVIRRPFVVAPTLTLGQEACYTLKRDEKGDFYVLAQNVGNASVLEKTAPNYDATMKLVRRVAKFIETPLDKSLTSKEASDRLLAAGMLILQYRTRPTSATPVQEEPIAAAESKLILAAIAEAEPTKVEPHLGTTPINLLYRLGLTEKDGWKPAADGGGVILRPAPPAPPGGGAARPTALPVANQSVEAAKAWLKANADTYRIKRFVAAKSDPVPSPGK